MINCYICGNKTSLKNNNLIALSNRMIVCKQCYNIHGGFKCQYCKLIYIGQDYNQTENCCKYCFQGMKLQGENNKLRFHNYYFKPYPVFYPKKTENTLYLGLQLQLGGVQDYNKVNKFAAYNQTNFFYIKKDSTIPKYGCQVVSYPATKDFHLSNKSKWKKLLSSAKRYCFKSFDIDNCGLHIHVNKDFFNEEEIVKLDCFVNKNKQFFEKISKRTSQFCRFLDKPDDLFGKPINANRHCALNLTSRDTIQFRMFKGTLKYQSVMSYIQFVYYLCNYIKTNNELNIQNFIKYISDNETKYLDKFIKKIGK